MKKIKWTTMTLAVVLGIGASFAFRPKPLASGLYYYNGFGYVPAGTEGVTYVCEESANVCTYILQNGVYTPYETAATYVKVDLNPSDEPAPSKKK